MAFPTLANGRVLPFLDKASVAILNEDYIGDKLIPVIDNLGKDQGKIPKYKPNMKVFSAKRSIWDESSHRMEWQLDTPGNYDIEYFDLENYIPDRIADQFDSPFDAEKDAKTFLEQAMSIIVEQTMAALFQSTAIITQNATPAVKWDAATGDPIADLEVGAETIRKAIGRRPTRLVLGATVMSKLKTNPSMVNRISGVKTTLGDEEIINILKTELKLKEILVGSAIYDSAADGQTETLVDLWGDFATLYYVPSVASLMTPSFAYTLKPKGRNGQKRLWVQRHAKDRGNEYNIDWARDDRVFEATAAYLLTDVLT